MNSLERYLGDTYDLVDTLKNSEQGFVVVVYDKRAKRLCTMKQRVGLSKICYNKSEKNWRGDLKAKGRIGRELENSFQLASFCRKSSKESNLLRA